MFFRNDFHDGGGDPGGGYPVGSDLQAQCHGLSRLEVVKAQQPDGLAVTAKHRAGPSPMTAGRR